VQLQTRCLNNRTLCGPPVDVYVSIHALQHTATHRNALQHTATRCNTLPLHYATFKVALLLHTWESYDYMYIYMYNYKYLYTNGAWTAATVAHCMANLVLHTPVLKRVLHTPVLKRCNTLQHAATHWKTICGARTITNHHMPTWCCKQTYSHIDS